MSAIVYKNIECNNANNGLIYNRELSNKNLVAAKNGLTQTIDSLITFVSKCSQQELNGWTKDDCVAQLKREKEILRIDLLDPSKIRNLSDWFKKKRHDKTNGAIDVYTLDNMVSRIQQIMHRLDYDLNSGREQIKYSQEHRNKREQEIKGSRGESLVGVVGNLVADMTRRPSYSIHFARGRSNSDNIISCCCKLICK